MFILSLPALPAASRAVTVIILFSPHISGISVADQLVVPEAVPLPPLLFVQVTVVTPTLSDALPPRLTVLLVVS